MTKEHFIQQFILNAANYICEHYDAESANNNSSVLKAYEYALDAWDFLNNK